MIGFDAIIWGGAGATASYTFACDVGIRDGLNATTIEGIRAC